MKKIVAIVAVLWLLLPCAVHAGEPPGPASGERLVYNIHWMGAPGGKSEMTFFRLEENRYRILVTVESIGLVDLIHTIRDRFEATGILSPAGPLADRFLKVMKNRKKEKKVELLFHREAGYAERFEGEGVLQERIEDLAAGVNDPLTAIYWVRLQRELKAGDRMVNGLIDGKRRYLSTVRVEDGGPLYGPLGWFDVWQVSPTLEPSELFRHEGGMEIWLTKDHRRLPVRVKSRVRVGNIEADLMAYDDGRGEHREFSQTGR